MSSDFLKVCIAILIVVAIAFSIDNFSCKKTAEKLNYNYEYSIWAGCILENAKGHKFLLEQLRNLQIQEVK